LSRLYRGVILNRSARIARLPLTSSQGAEYFAWCGELWNIVAGSVVKILPKSVLIQYQDTTVLIPQHELLSPNAKFENPVSLFSVGDNVEFVLTSRDQRGWRGSVHALTEARLRNALGNLQPGTAVRARVERFDDRGAWLLAGALCSGCHWPRSVGAG
jgi:ribosomal protein S1